MRKKIVFISPKPPESMWSLTGICEMIRRPAPIPPLGLATLAALTPSHYEIQIIDENIETIDFDIVCDLVGITGYTVHNARMFDIAKAFQIRGVLTVGGGAFCSSHPDMAREHFDVVVVGEAERVWPGFLKEWEKGIHQPFYEEIEQIDFDQNPSPIPRWDLIKVDQYLSQTVQTTRGCPYDCEFCDVVSLFGRKSRHKPIKQVLEELQQLSDLGAYEILFADDNFIGNRKYAKELLTELIPFNQALKVPMRYITQITLNCADDDELLDLLKRARFHSLFIGIESPKRESLIATNKHHNITKDMKKSVHKIQSRGILVIAAMIVGFDTDDVNIFDFQKKFLQEAGIIVPMVGMLMAPRGTKLWDRLEQERRLVDFDFGDSQLGTNIVPKLMSREELEANYLKLLQTIYSKEFLIKNFEIYMKQIDLREIWKESSVIQFFNLRKSPFFYTLYGFRVIWAHLISSRSDRSLLFNILKITIKKSPICLPLGIAALAYFRTLISYTERQTAAITQHRGKITQT